MVMVDEVYINVADGLKRVVNNSKLFSNLLAKFKNYTHVSEIEAAFAEGDIEKAKNTIHTLKGLAAQLSLTELYKQVMELEIIVRAGGAHADQLQLVKNVHVLTLTEVDKVIQQYA